ncbi:MAG: succinate dehydrogenase assembly factor 2 [Novosphingobium sp.]
MSDPARVRRLKFRAWHRGTREADYIMGCFFDRHHHGWSEPELAWFEALLKEEDPDVMGWVLGGQEAPDRFAGPMMAALQRLDYVDIRH